jgi:hypothetical protein
MRELALARLAPTTEGPDRVAPAHAWDFFQD